MKTYDQNYNNELAINKDVEGLIKYNKDFIRSFARKYSTTEYLEDLISECHIAIISAIETYDSTKVNFLSWAKIYMKKYCSKFMDKHSRNIRLPHNVLYAKEFAEVKKNYKQPITTQTEIGDGLIIEDMLTEVIDEPKYKEHINNDHIKKYLSKLTPKQQLILEWYFGINKDEKLNMTEIGDKLNMNRKIVSYHYNKALNKLNRLMNHLK